MARDTFFKITSKEVSRLIMQTFDDIHFHPNRWSRLGETPDEVFEKMIASKRPDLTAEGEAEARKAIKALMECEKNKSKAHAFTMCMRMCGHDDLVPALTPEMELKLLAASGDALECLICYCNMKLFITLKLRSALSPRVYKSIAKHRHFNKDERAFNFREYEINDEKIKEVLRLLRKLNGKSIKKYSSASEARRAQSKGFNGTSAIKNDPREMDIPVFRNGRWEDAEY